VSTLPRSNTHLKIGPRAQHLRLRAAPNSCRRARPGQIAERFRDFRRQERVARILARQQRHAMTRPSGKKPSARPSSNARPDRSRPEQRVFQLLDEQAFAAGIGERAVLDAVAGGPFTGTNPQSMPFGRQRGAHHFGLHQGKLGGAGAEGAAFAAWGLSR
jgi:hypothetical protein